MQKTQTLGSATVAAVSSRAALPPVERVAAQYLSAGPETDGRKAIKLLLPLRLDGNSTYETRLYGPGALSLNAARSPDVVSLPPYRGVITEGWLDTGTAAAGQPVQLHFEKWQVLSAAVSGALAPDQRTFSVLNFEIPGWRERADWFQQSFQVLGKTAQITVRDLAADRREITYVCLAESLYGRIVNPGVIAAVTRVLVGKDALGKPRVEGLDHYTGVVIAPATDHPMLRVSRWFSSKASSADLPTTAAPLFEADAFHPATGS